jgi:hypothetical protein
MRMKNKRILLTISAVILMILAAYVTTFYRIFGFQLSGDTAVWGQFGDYIGGTLNPILSFISIILLIKSVSLQNEANESLRDELTNSEKTERFRSFNSLFFSMIESQRVLLRELTIGFGVGPIPVREKGAAAIIRLENEIEILQANQATKQDISEYIENLDKNDQIFGVLRAFYITVKMICEKLDDTLGFVDLERKEQTLTLINLTDFAQLRLVAIGIQFLDYPSCNYLKNNEIFITAAAESNLPLGAY